MKRLPSEGQDDHPSWRSAWVGRPKALQTAARRLRGPAGRRLDDESGAVIVIVAVLMVVLLSVAALVVDLGGLFDHDRDLQTLADAGALAGAQELIYTQGDQTAAGANARAYVSTNAGVSDVVEGNLAAWSPVVDATSVTVDLREDHVPFFFARVFGSNEGSVRAHAKAATKYVTGVQKLFPVAVLQMNPEKFRFVVQGVGSFDIIDAATEGDKDGIFDTGGGTLPAAAPGTYNVTLQAISKDKNGVEQVALELPDIGIWRVSDPGNVADPKSQLYLAGMQKTGGTITVRAVFASTVTAEPVKAQLGKSNFNLTWISTNGDGSRVYQGSVSAPTGVDNRGYATYDLEISVPTGQGNKTEDVLAGRYVAFDPDLPLKSLMMTQAFYSGYSRIVGQPEYQGASIVTRQFKVGDTYVMKLGSGGGSGLYSGNWRLADIWAQVNTADEIAKVDPPADWTLTISPLVLGGDLKPETGNKVGQVVSGLDQRLAPQGNNTPMTDPRRVVIIPIVNYAPDLSGTSQNYVISGFAAFRVTHYSTSNKGGEDKSEITGQFIHWAEPGSWQDAPPGPLYVETAVLTE